MHAGRYYQLTGIAFLCGCSSFASQIDEVSRGEKDFVVFDAVKKYPQYLEATASATYLRERMEGGIWGETDMLHIVGWDCVYSEWNDGVRIVSLQYNHSELWFHFVESDFLDENTVLYAATQNAEPEPRWILTTVQTFEGALGGKPFFFEIGPVGSYGETLKPDHRSKAPDPKRQINLDTSRLFVVATSGDDVLFIGRYTKANQRLREHPTFPPEWVHPDSGYWQ